MFWRTLGKIAMDTLVSLIVEFVFFTVRTFFVNYSKSQAVRNA